MAKKSRPVYIGVSLLGGHSFLSEDDGWITSVMNPEAGTVDTDRLENMAKYVAHRSGNWIRDFTWAHDANSAVRLDKDAWGFYEQLGLMANTYRSYQITFCYDLFNHPQIKHYPEWDMWGHFVDSFYSGTRRAKREREEHIHSAVSEMKEAGSIYNICNEPAPGEWEFAASVFCELIKAGVPPQNIMLPYDMRLKKRNPYMKDYFFMKREVERLMGKNYDQIMKTQCLSAMHNCNMANVKEFFGPNVKPGASRSVVFDSDGLRLTAKEWGDIARYIIEERYTALGKGKIHFSAILGKMINDPANTLIEITNAYQVATGRTLNNGHYPNAKLPYRSPTVTPEEPGKDPVKETRRLLHEALSQLDRIDCRIAK